MFSLFNNYKDIVSSLLDIEIINKIKEKSGEIYLVGGAVRDIVIGRLPKDYDFCITKLTRREFEYIFPEAKCVGNSFPVYLMNDQEFALARNDKNNETERKLVDFSIKDFTIVEDLFRRDFTINAMAINMKTGELLDPFGGEKDLRKKVIKHVSSAFADDKLRIYRASRLAAQLDFYIADDTVLLMRSLRDHLNFIPKERVFEELRKAINSMNPDKFFRGLLKADCLSAHFIEIKQLYKVPQPSKSHPEGDAFEHTMRSLKASTKLTDKEEIRFAALVHDVGKARTPNDLLPKHYGHDKAGIKPFLNLCNRLNLPKRWRAAGLLAVEEHMRLRLWREMKPEKLVHLIEKARKNPIGLEGLKIVCLCDSKGRDDESIADPDLERFVKIIQNEYIQINGSYIKGIPEGCEFGEALFRYKSKWIKKRFEK